MMTKRLWQRDGAAVRMLDPAASPSLAGTTSKHHQCEWGVECGKTMNHPQDPHVGQAAAEMSDGPFPVYALAPDVKDTIHLAPGTHAPTSDTPPQEQQQQQQQKRWPACRTFKPSDSSSPGKPDAQAAISIFSHCDSKEADIDPSNHLTANTFSDDVSDSHEHEANVVQHSECSLAEAPEGTAALIQLYNCDR